MDAGLVGGATTEADDGDDVDNEMTSTGMTTMTASSTPAMATATVGGDDGNDDDDGGGFRGLPLRCVTLLKLVTHRNG